MSADYKRIWSWRQVVISSSLPATTRHVLLTLACFMNDLGGGCYPTTKQLAAATGLSERAVCTHLDIAEATGWIAISQHGLRGQKWKNNQYQASWPEGEGTERASMPSEVKALNVVPKGTERRSQKALNVVQSNSPNNPSNKQERAGAREALEGKTSKPRKLSPIDQMIADGKVDMAAAKAEVHARRGELKLAQVLRPMPEASRAND